MSSHNSRRGVRSKMSYRKDSNPGYWYTYCSCGKQIDKRYSSCYNCRSVQQFRQKIYRPRKDWVDPDDDTEPRYD